LKPKGLPTTTAPRTVLLSQLLYILLSSLSFSQHNASIKNYLQARVVHTTLKGRKLIVLKKCSFKRITVSKVRMPSKNHRKSNRKTAQGEEGRRSSFGGVKS
jgi:hypothetical protein